MDDQSTPTLIQDAVIAQPTAEDMAKEASSQFMDLHALIKRYVSSLTKVKTDIKIQKDMFESAFLNDEVYQQHDKAVKEATKVKNVTKNQILKQPAIAQLDEKLKDLKLQFKELQENLSVSLLEYQKETGASQIELDDGEVLDLVPSIRLVKRSASNKKF